jgi:hypothetical protein
MSRYKNEQHSLAHNGHTYHFISYEGTNASPRAGLAATPPSWFLVSAGKRWEVMPQIPDQSEAELNAKLAEWIELNVTS